VVEGLPEIRFEGTGGLGLGEGLGEGLGLKEGLGEGVGEGMIGEIELLDLHPVKVRNAAPIKVI
jgi:hypothetical protein